MESLRGYFALHRRDATSPASPAPISMSVAGSGTWLSGCNSNVVVIVKSDATVWRSAWNTARL